MNVKKLIAAVAVFAAAGSAFAQQSEFVAPDASFNSTLTRAEVRQDLTQATSQGAIAQRQHDGQDTVYAASTRSRQEVRAEAIQSAQSHRAGDVNNLYFGA
jgi:precorrin-4 methylase